MQDQKYNNIFNKKNIELTLDGMQDRLPYKDDLDVKLKANQIIFTSINNIFQRLLDNDLYNEAVLKKYVEYGIVGGPTYVSSINQVEDDSFLNKKFVVSGDNGISVLRKEEIDVSDTLSGRYLDGTKVNYVTLINERYVACTENGIYESIDKINWTRRVGQDGIDVIDLAYNYNFLNNTIVSAYDYIAVANNGADIVFYGHDGITNEWKDFSATPALTSVRIGNAAATSIFSFEDDPSLYVGTDTRGLLASKLLDANDSFSTNLGTDKWAIYDMAKIPYADSYENYMLATNYGIKQSRKKNGFKNFNVQSSSSNLYVYDAFGEHGLLYVATGSGLHVIDTNTQTTTWIRELNGIPCYSIAKSEGRIYVGTQNGVYLLLSRTNATRIGLEEKTIQKIASFSNAIFAYVQSENKIAYSKTNSAFETLTDISLASDEFVKQFVLNNSVLYIVTNKTVYAVKDGNTSNVFSWTESFAGNSNVHFAQNLPNGRIAAQVNDRIYILNGNVSENAAATANYAVLQQNEVVSNIASYGDNELFLSIDGYLYRMFKEDPNRPFDLDKVYSDGEWVRAEKIGFFRSSFSGFTGLILLDSSKKLKFLEYNQGFGTLTPISTPDTFKDILVYENGLYALSSNGESISRFGVEPQMELNELTAIPSNDGVSIKQYEESFGIVENHVTMGRAYLSTFSTHIDLETYTNSDYAITASINDSNGIRCGDFVGYVDNSDEKKSLLIGEANGTIRLHNIEFSDALTSMEIDTEGAPVQGSQSNANAFADICYRNEDTGLVENAMNFVASQNGIHVISATSLLAEELIPDEISQINCAEKFQTEDDLEKTFIGTDSGVYILDPSEIANFRNANYGQSVKMLSKRGTELIGSSNGQNILISAQLTDNTDISWEPLFDSSDSTEFAITGYVGETTAFFDLSSDSGCILNVQPKTLSYDENGSTFIVDPYENCILTGDVSVNALSSIYKVNGQLKAVDIYGNVYDLSVDAINNTVRITADYNQEDDPKTLDKILSEKLANSYEVTSGLSIGNELDDANIIRSMMSELDDRIAIISSNNVSSLTNISNVNLPLTSDVLNVPEWNRRSSLQCNDPILSVSFDFSNSGIQSISAIPYIQISSVVYDDSMSAVPSSYCLSTLVSFSQTSSAFVLSDQTSEFADAVYEHDIVEGNNIVYSAGLSIGSVLYAQGYDAINSSIDLSWNLSSTLDNTQTIVKYVPSIQETNDNIYYDSVYSTNSVSDKEYYIGYFIGDASLEPKIQLLFTGNELCAFESLSTTKRNELLGFTQIAASISNDNFNDLYYFRIGDNFETYSIRKTSISSHDKDFLKAKYSTDAGSVRKISLERNFLYVVTTAGSVYYTSTNDFPEFKQVGFPSNVGSFKELDSCGGYSLIAFENGNAVKIFRYEDGQQNGVNPIFSNDATHGNFESFFHDDSNVYIETSNGIWRLNVNGSNLEKISDFVKRDNVKAIGDDFVIGDAYLYMSEMLYDFKNKGYSRLTNDTLNEEVVDMKVRNGDTSQPLLYAATKTGIYQYKFANFSEGIEYSRRKISDGISFSNIKGIYFTNDSSQRLYVIDGSNLYIYSNFAEESDLSDLAFEKFENFLTGTYADKITINDFKTLHPIAVMKDSANEIKQETKFIKQAVKDIPKAMRFIDNGTSNKYVYSSTALSGISSANNSSDFSLSLKREYAPNSICSKEAIVDKNGTSLWGFRKDNGVKKIKEIKLNGGDDSTYDVLGNPLLSSLFFDSRNTVYAGASGDGAGLYKKKLIDGYILDDNDRVYVRANALDHNKDEVFSLAFLRGDDYVLNYLHREELDGNAVQISKFASSNGAIEDYLLSNYISTVGATVLSPLFNRYLFISDGGNGYVYNYRLNKGNDLPLYQLDQAANGLASLMFLKESNGLGLLGYGRVFGTFTGFSDLKMFDDVDILKYTAMANNFKRGTKKIMVLNEKPDFLVGTTYGLKYVYDDMMTRSFYDKDNAVAIDKTVNSIEKVLDVDNGDFFIVGAENSLYEVTDLKNATFRKIYQFDEDEAVLDTFAVQKNEYLIATTKGIYTTSLAYRLANDLKRFTIDNIYEIINDELKKIIDNHVSKEHRPTSIVTKVNEKADNKLSFLSSEDKHKDLFVSSFANSIKVVENDIIDTIVRGGESPDGESYIKVGIKNWAVSSLNPKATYANDGFINVFTDANSGKTFDISTVPYIVKNWKSGLKEIYIYVPSTGTYYANNPQGISNSQYSYNAYQRDNVPNVSLLNTLPNACTTLRVYLYNSYFKIKTIIAAQCTGNSLPLKIYKDNVNADDAWKGVFDTAIQPSALRTLPMTNDSDVNNVRICTDDLERIFLDFSIYGTDAQAIRIIAES